MTRLGSILFLAIASTASAQVPAGGDFLVNTHLPSFQILPHPAMEPDGDFVVSWTSYLQDGSYHGVFAQRFAAPGTPRGVEFRVNTYTTDRQIHSTMAVGTRGDFVVAWTSFQDGSGGSVQGQRYDSAGNRAGAEFQVNTYTTGFQLTSRLARGPDGGFIVVFTSQSFDGSMGAIGGRRFDRFGNPIGGDFLVNSYTTGNQQFPDIAFEADGGFAVVWVEDNFGHRDGSGSGIFGQRFDASGARRGGDFQVNTFTTGDQYGASVSASPEDGFVVVWTTTDASGWGTAARRFDAAGNGVGDEFRVNTYTTGNQSRGGKQIAHDARGNFVVTWTGPGNGDDYGVFAQRFSASGARRGGEFAVNGYTIGQQARPAVASDAVGNFVVAWEGYAPSDVGVFARRFGGLSPSALSVDASGNQVLEPGETVEVRPSWRNINGAAQTFSGTLTNITGPAGATYTITDPTGDYGTVPNDTNGPCLDCYAVAVSNPPTRPAVHWDASAVESILPDTQGQRKQWLLHIGDSFTDVPRANGFYRFVETLLHHSVTGGCSPTQYCPGSSTTREQMAVFVLVAKEGTGYVPPACTTPMFADVPASSPFCRWIEELARRGVVSGCGGGNYCPANPVTREQMAVFVLRTLEPTLNPPACVPPNIYNDVPETSPFCPWIEELTRRAVVTGCGGGNYCPTAAVTREQMGVFISVTFGLTLYGP